MWDVSAADLRPVFIACNIPSPRRAVLKVPLARPHANYCAGVARCAVRLLTPWTMSWRFWLVCVRITWRSTC